MARMAAEAQALREQATVDSRRTFEAETAAATAAAARMAADEKGAAALRAAAAERAAAEAALRAEARVEAQARAAAERLAAEAAEREAAAREAAETRLAAARREAAQQREAAQRLAGETAAAAAARVEALEARLSELEGSMVLRDTERCAAQAAAAAAETRAAAERGSAEAAAAAAAVVAASVVRAAATVRLHDDRDELSAPPHQKALELVRDIEACRQWVAYHVARGEYKDAVELGWDGANPPAPTERELVEASLAAYAAAKNEASSSPRHVSVEVAPRSRTKPTAHASPSARLCPQPPLPVPRDECIEVTARPLANPHLQNMIEVAAYPPTPPTLPSSMSISPSRPVHRQSADEHSVHLTILERQASFLESAKANERLEESAINEAAARVNERLERARKHNKQVARQAAASTTVGRRVRGHLTRLRLRREREAARMAEMQRETERVWAETRSLTRGSVIRDGARAPSGRRAESVEARLSV